MTQNHLAYPMYSKSSADGIISHVITFLRHLMSQSFVHLGIFRHLEQANQKNKAGKHRVVTQSRESTAFLFL